MDISLINAGLAAGVTLAALPFILHLFMKQTPKHIIFPALRLIRERQKRSRKKIKIKNWLLLLARMALLALMALALARPRLWSNTSLGDREVPTALGLVFDTSLSMDYEQSGKTRLAEAKDSAYEILKKTPESSQVFVVDSAEPGIPPPLSPAAARKRIEALSTRPMFRPLNDAVGQAYTAVSESERDRHEVYVLTDLARSAWDTNRAVDGLDKLKKVKNGVATYVLRFAPKDVTDIAVSEAEPSSAVATQGESIVIRAKVRAQGPAVSRVVEFKLDGVSKGKEAVNIPANGEVEVKFTTPKLDPKVPLHQGLIKLSGAPDPLPFDDTRFFSFKVQPARKVLVITDRADDAEYITDALDPDPDTLPVGASRSFQVKRLLAKSLTASDRDTFKDYTCIFINNTQSLKEDDWGKLNAYIHEGGGLIIGLGNRCEAENYNSSLVAQVVPGKLEKKTHIPNGTRFGKVHDFTHPLFARYAREIEPELARLPVLAYWKVTPAQETRTLMSYADGAPALIERTLKGAKTGRVLLWTTPLSTRPDLESSEAWQEFPKNWTFLAVMLETVPYLAGGTAERLNYTAGENVILAIDPTRRFKNYVIQQEDSKTPETLTPPVTNDSLVIVSPQPLGQWKVTAVGANGEKESMGFSVNPPLSESQFVPLETAQLDALFGKDNYQLADDPKGISEVVKVTRLGRELFPWIMALILIIVTLENLLANKFHREAGSRVAAGATT